MKKGTGTAPASAGQPVGEADEFAAIPRPRTRHPLLALGAGLLALFLVVKMRADLRYFLSASQPADLGDARALVASERGRAVLAEGANRLVSIRGTPDRESALQVDTKGSWTFTQFFKLLGTDSRIFVHRREDPLPAFRAERDVFEGRLIRFSDLSFEDAIRAHFAGHVSSTHFFAAGAVLRAVAAGADQPASLRDLTGDTVVLGPNDILAIVLRHPAEVEVGLPMARFADATAASAALAARGARVIGPGRPAAERHVFVVAVPTQGRDQLLDGIGDIDQRVKIHDVRETVKARLTDLTVDNGVLALRAPAGGAGTSALRVLENIDSIRTLGTVQIPADAYLIVEAETPRDHLADVAVALVLLVFATVNLVGLGKGLRS
ncbi:MAG: hypothetical protein ABUL67_01240 [Haliangium ochraceum]